MNIVIDMNLTPRWVDFFAANGFAALHWSRIADVRAADDDIANWCRERRQVLVTNDLDFARILALSGEAGPSVLLLRGSPLSPEARGAGVIRILAECANEVDAGAIVTLDWGENFRVRLLPIG